MNGGGGPIVKGGWHLPQITQTNQNLRGEKVNVTPNFF